MEQVIILINPQCHQGKGWKRWKSIRDDVRQRVSAKAIEIVVEKGTNFKATLHPLLQSSEEKILISAGGDGSIHFLLNYLMKEQNDRLPFITLGAIGLGSSNDFLKPFDQRVKNIPVRINMGTEKLFHDVGYVSYRDASGNMRTKYFLVNASVGITAEANWRYNNPSAILRSLKKTSTQTSILYTAVSTILQYRNVPMTVAYNETKTTTSISNINILKIPYVSGSFFYNQPIARDDGRLALNACVGMSKWELLGVLSGLQKGKFPATAKTTTAFTQSVSLKADEPFVFECDGETEKTTALKLSILPNQIRVLKA